MIVAEALRGKTNLVLLKGEWDRLMAQREHEPSVSFEWTAALMESHVQEHDEVIFIILKRAEAVIGIVPLVARQTKVMGQTIVRVFPVSEFYNTHSDLLLEDVSAPVLEAFIEALYRLGSPWDVFSMTRLLEVQPLGLGLAEAVQRHGKRFDVQKEHPSFVLTLDETYEGYLHRRSGSFRNALKRIERKLIKRGRVEIRSHEEFPSIDQAYEALLCIERRSWKQGHGTSISSVSRQTTFYRRLCFLASVKSWLHLRFLYLDDQPVAYNLGLIIKDTYFYLKTSYDHAERPLSPATLLRARLIEELIGRGVKHFDFPGDPYEWESQWAEDVRSHQSLTLFGRTFKGFAYGLYRKAKHFGQKRGSVGVTYVDPKALKP